MGATVQAQGRINNAVVQSVLLYGSESWVVTGYMLKVLKGLQNWVEIRIMGMMAQSKMIREWECPPVSETMYTDGLYPIKEYIQRRQATIEAQVA